MVSRAEFESIAGASGFHDFEVSGNGCYCDDFLQHFYAGWQASRQALEGEASNYRPTLGQRKAAQIGPVIGVLVQNQEGKVCAVTDLGRCTWLREDVTGAGVCLCGEVKWQDCPLHGLKQGQAQ